MRSIYFDDNWAILQQEKEGGIAEIYQYFDGSCRVEYIFIMRKAGVVDGVQYYDIITPRGMGGPRLTNHGSFNLKQYDEEFKEYCSKNRIIAEYVRFDPWNNNHQIFGCLYDELEHHGDLFCNDLNEDFFKIEYDNDVRRVIKKNMSSIEVRFDFEGNEIDRFLEVYKYTEQKYNVEDYYHLTKNMLKKYFCLLEGKVAIATAMYGGEVASSSVILFGEDIVHYHFAGNNPQYKKMYANTVLIYQATLLAQKMKKKLFDFGGGIVGASTAGYKRQFVGKKGVYPYFVGKRILNKEIYQKLIELNGKYIDGYFPEYQRIG